MSKTQNIIKKGGICSIELLDCGCKIKRYFRSKTITVSCGNPEHPTKIEWICNICNKDMGTKKELKNHQWSHAQ